MVQDTPKNPSLSSPSELKEEVSADLVEHQLAQILSSPHFKSAKQMQKFLQYIVRKTLAGNADNLKQYTIAVEALGFPTDFDSDINPVVRIQAGRVRERLEKYYYKDGENDALIISLPKGSYTPLFEKKARTKKPLQEKAGHSTPPKLAVLCYSDETQNKESNRLLFQITDTMAKELSTFLFSKLVVSIPHADKTQARNASLDMHNRYGADYMLIFYIQQLPKNKHILLVRLMDVEHEEVLWSESFDIDSGEPFHEKDDVIASIAVVVADIQLGILPRHWARKLLANESTIPDAYKALAYYRYYADDLGRDALEKVVRSCEKQLERVPDDVIASVLYADYCRRDYVYNFGIIDSPLEAGTKAAFNAIRLRPDSHETHFTLGQILFCKKEWQQSLNEFRLVRKMCQYHAYVMYGVGFHFYLMGEREEGLALVNKVMALTPAYPDWFNIIPFFDYYLHEDYKEALHCALKINMPIKFNSSMAKCAAYARLGEIDKAKKELKKVINEIPDFMEKGQVIFERFIGSEELAEPFWEAILIAHKG